MRWIALGIALAAVAVLLLIRDGGERARTGRPDDAAARAPAPVDAPSTSTPARAEPDATPDLVIAGRVTDGDGTEIADASVRALDGAETTTDARGRFALAVPHPGRWALWARAEGFAPATKRVRAPTDRVELVLERGRLRAYVVVDTRGRAVAGAAIAIGHHRRLEHAVPVARADGNGRFSLRVRGKETLIVRADGYATRAVGTDTERIVLDPGMHVGGRVVDTSGAPVAGARVTVEPDDLPPERTRTAADGRFRFTTVPANHDFDDTRVTAAAPGYATARTRAVPGDTALTIVLPRAALLRGVLVGPDGAPRGGIEVDIEREHPHDEVEVDSGADGAFTADVAPGHWRITAEDKGPPRLVAATAVTLDEGEVRDIRVALEALPTSYVDLRVVDDAGRAKSGVYTRCYSGENRRSRLRATDAHGLASHTLEVAPGTPVDVTVRTRNPAVHHRVTATTTARPGKRTVEVALPAPALLEVVVRDVDGAAVPGAVVKVGGTPADREGVWRVDPGMKNTVRVTAPGYADARRELPRLGPGAHRVVVEIARAATVVGRIVGPGGAPVAASVHVHYRADGYGRMYSERSEDDGRFRIRDLPPGPVRLRFARTFAAVEAAAELDVAAGEVRDLGDVRLAGRRTVRGRVLDQAGRPLPGARVEFHPDRRSWTTEIADMDGRYEIDVPLHGEGYLLFARPRHGVRLVSFADGPPGPRLDVRLPPESRVVAHAPASVGFESVIDPRTGIRWDVSSQELAELQHPTPRVVVGFLPPGPHRLRFRVRGVDGVRTVERDVDVPPGETIEIRLD